MLAVASYIIIQLIQYKFTLLYGLLIEHCIRSSSLKLGLKSKWVSYQDLFLCEEPLILMLL